MLGTAVAPASCPERQSLLNQIEIATHDLSLVQDEQVKAIISGNLTANQVIHARLLRARKRKDLLVAQLIQHIQAHDCTGRAVGSRETL